MSDDVTPSLQKAASFDDHLIFWLPVTVDYVSFQVK